MAWTQERKLYLAAVICCAAGSMSAAARSEAVAKPSTFIVSFKPSVASVGAQSSALARLNGFTPRYKYTHALKGFAASLSARQVAALRADPSVESIMPDRVVHAFDLHPLLSQSVPTGVRRINAATSTLVHQASPVGVAVIDTGIDLTNPDLNVAPPQTNTVTVPDDCAKGAGSADDDNGHGTHVSGTIAAKNASTDGVVGVAPGTTLYAVKVLDSAGSGDDASVICGIDWVTANAAVLNIKVANMSLGGFVSPGEVGDDGNCGKTNDDAEHQAICNSTAAGVTYTVAAGNSGMSYDTFTPAAYHEVLTTTAIVDYDGLPGGKGSTTCGTWGADDTLAWFSNHMSTPDYNHTVAAPGVCIWSTWRGHNYRFDNGTSMASPHVAGLVARCFGEVSGGVGVSGPCATLNPSQVIQKIVSESQVYTALTDPGYGFSDSTGGLAGSLVWDGSTTNTFNPSLLPLNPFATPQPAISKPPATASPAPSAPSARVTTPRAAVPSSPPPVFRSQARQRKCPRTVGLLKGKPSRKTPHCRKRRRHAKRRAGRQPKSH